MGDIMKSYEGQGTSKIIVFEKEELNLFYSMVSFCSSNYELFGFSSKSDLKEYLKFFES